MEWAKNQAKEEIGFSDGRPQIQEDESVLKTMNITTDEGEAQQIKIQNDRLQTFLHGLQNRAEGQKRN